MYGATDDSPSPAMTAVYSGAIAAAATGLIYGMSVDVPLPGGIGLRAPLGMAVHVGLSSFLSNSYIDPTVQKQSQSITWISADNLKTYAPPVETGLVTGGLLMLAGDQTVGSGYGAVIGGLSELAAQMIKLPSGMSDVHSNVNSGNYVGGCCGRSTGNGHSASMYSLKY